MARTSTKTPQVQPAGKKELHPDINYADGIVPVSRAAAGLSELIRRVRTSRQPIVVTQQGYGAAVLVDIESFQELVSAYKARSGQAEEQQDHEGEPG